MAAVVIIGGGVAGLGGAMLLARDGHQVTVLERDPAPPPPAPAAWAEWERRGVTQFRLPHLFMARFRELLEAELPEVVPALEAARRAAREPPRDTAVRDHRRDARRRRALRSDHWAAADGRSDAGAAGCRRARRRGPPRRRRPRPGPGRARTRRRAAHHRRRHRRRRRAPRGPCRRCRWPPFGAARSDRGGGCPPAGRGGRRQWLRVLRPSLPLRRRVDAADVRRAAAPLRLGVDAHVASRQRPLVGRRDDQRR